MKQTILVIDDESGVRESLYNALEKAGYKAVTVPGGQAAVESFKSKSPDLVLLDIRMPDKDGVEILKELRSFDQDTKIVMLVDIGTEKLVKEAREKGATAFLPKEVGPDIIVKAINQIFQVKKDYKGKKILVVDDDPDICSSLRDFLSKTGFNVMTASTGEEALEKVKEKNPILILLDIKLPGMDGIVTLKRIREIDEKVGVIMITGVRDQGVFDEARKLGVYEYIVKPFSLDYLEKKVLVWVYIVSALAG